MANSRGLCIAIGTLVFFGLITPVALAAPPADATTEPAVATQIPEDSPSEPAEPQNCRYKPLPGSHIKVHVCTSRDGVEYRMDRRARTNAVVIAGPFGEPVAAPLPQVQ
jgi:hypothetical protein